MSKLQLAKDIKKHEGFILSDGTLKTETLLAKAFELLKDYNIKCRNMKKEIAQLYTLENFIIEDLNEQCLLDLVYHGLAKIDKSKYYDANEIWNDDIYNLFNSFSPKGYYFGSNIGDGSCIGWFKETECQ